MPYSNPAQTLDFWSLAFAAGYADLVRKVGSFLPNLVAALVVFFIGWMCAELAGNLTRRLVNLLRIDQLFAALGVKQIFKHAGIDLHVAATVAALVKWLIIAVFLIVVADVFGLKQVADFLTRVTGYLPNVIAAAVILVIGLVVANAVSEAVLRSARVYKLASAQLAAGIVKWSILVFVFMAMLVQLQIAASMVQTLFTGIVAALALTLGISFGLGGKDLAQKILDKLSQDLGAGKQQQ